MYGWKVLVLIEVQTRLPLAMKVVQIQDYEGKWLVPLLEQAQHNLGTMAHIETIVIDRGYLDGADLWRCINGVRVCDLWQIDDGGHTGCPGHSQRRAGGGARTRGATWPWQNSQRATFAHRSGRGGGINQL